jgi:hypothetical protein
VQREENIKQNSVDNKCIIYDAVAGELKKLEFDKLHRGIVKKGRFLCELCRFCRDEGNRYDIVFSKVIQVAD